MPDVAFDDLLRGRDPAEARARGDDLGEGVEAHDAPVRVHAEEGWDQGCEEFLVGFGEGR